jgi:hypothetical protein
MASFNKINDIIASSLKVLGLSNTMDSGEKAKTKDSPIFF